MHTAQCTFSIGEFEEPVIIRFTFTREIGCRGVINKRNHLVLETICNLVKIRGRKKLSASLGRIALLGSYRIWLARHSQQWTGGELIK